MFLTTVVSALTLGAGVKLYRERKSMSRGTREKKETPCDRRECRARLRALRMKRNQRRKGGTLNMSQGVLFGYGKRAKRLVSDVASALSSQERYQQQQAISASFDVVNALDRKLTRNLWLSIGFTGVTAFGLTFYPPLSLVGVTGVLYMCQPILHKVYQDIKARRVTTDVGDVIMITGVFVSGHLFLGTMLMIFSSLLWKLLVKTARAPAVKFPFCATTPSSFCRTSLVIFRE